MLLYSYNQGGGFGNVVFSQFAAILFAILFNGNIINIDKMDKIIEFKNKSIEINDDMFIHIINNKLNNNINIIDIKKNYFLCGYFQHDTVYNLYKKEIISYIQNNPNITLFASHYANPYKLINIIEYKNTKIYDVVIHLRLNDFIS